MFSSLYRGVTGDISVVVEKPFDDREQLAVSIQFACTTMGSASAWSQNVHHTVYDIDHHCLVMIVWVEMLQS